MPRMPRPTTSTIIRERRTIASRSCDVLIHDAPPEIVDVISELIDKSIWLLPPWCEQLDIVVSAKADGDEAAHASVEVSETYRTAMVTLYPAFASSSPCARLNTIVHELLHLHISHLDDWVSDLIDQTLEADNPELHAFVGSELDGRVEGAICDLARVISIRIASHFAQTADVSAQL